MYVRCLHPILNLIQELRLRATVIGRLLVNYGKMFSLKYAYRSTFLSHLSQRRWRCCRKRFIFLEPLGQFHSSLLKKHPWVMGITVWSHEGPRHLLRGDNNKIAKIH